MISTERLENNDIDALVLQPFEDVLRSVGTEKFYKSFIANLTERIAVDRLYLFEGSALTTPLVMETEPTKPAVQGTTYVDQFLPSDPLQAALRDTTDEETVLRLIVKPEDIQVPLYRKMLERAGVIERVSFVRRLGKARWRCMTVVRREALGRFEDRDLSWLGSYYRLVTPLVDLHRRLVGEVVEDRADRIEELEQRFAQRFPALTQRERQICARAAIGISVEGAALDLGIGSASVLTYRRRAYQRLNVSSAYELARLVLR